MARQVGAFVFTGTFGDITCYKMYDTYYARMKSSLSRKKVLTSPRFARTRMHANQLAEASQIASQLYRSIPKEKKNRQLFNAFVGKAKVLLAEGKEKEVVLEVLMNQLFPQTKKLAPKHIKKKKIEERAYISKAGRLIWKPFRYLNLTKEGRTTEPVNFKFHPDTYRDKSEITASALWRISYSINML